MSFQTILHSIKSEIKENLSISISMISSQVIFSCSGFIGTAMIARLGADALAAGVLVSMTWMSLTVLFFGLLNSINVLVAHQFGARNNKAISDIMGQGYLLGMIVSVLIILILLAMPYFLRFSSQPPIVIKLATQYMHALLYTIPGLVALVVCEQFLAGINRTKIVLRISLLVVPIEIPIIYAWIFGKFGLPACGVAGIGYGFATTYTLSAIGLLYYLRRSKQYAPYGLFQSINKFNFVYLREMIRVGLPMGFMHVIEVCAFAAMTFAIAQFGTTMLAAHQIVMQYIGLAITIVFAMSQAVTVRVGHCVGRMDLISIRYATYVGMFLSFAIMLIIALIFVLAPHWLLQLDINTYNPANQPLIHDATLLLAISSLLLIFDNFRLIGFGALRGLKDTRFPMFASFFAFWVVGLFLAYLFSFDWHNQAAGIWWGVVLGIASGMIIVFIRFEYMLRKVDLKQVLHIPTSRH